MLRNIFVANFGKQVFELPSDKGNNFLMNMVSRKFLVVRKLKIQSFSIYNKKLRIDGTLNHPQLLKNCSLKTKTRKLIHKAADKSFNF